MSTYIYPSECIKCGRSSQHSLYGNQYVECSCTKVDAPTMTTLRQVPTVADMTLRDWFAGQALMGLLAARNPTTPRFHPDDDAQYVHAVADAMLHAREEKP